MGGTGLYPVAGGAPLALCTPRPLEDGIRLGGAPLGAAPRGSAACSGGTPPRLLTRDTNIRPGLDEREEELMHVLYLISFFGGDCNKFCRLLEGGMEMCV